MDLRSHEEAVAPVPRDSADAAARRHPQEHHLRVTRTARYVTLGRPHAGLREVWIVCHGHGQLAARFIRHFMPLDDGTRLFVAPEALSRYYIDAPGTAPTTERRVGGTWMTREDRLSEINDYIGYLDALHTHIFRQVDRSAVRLHVLGFSQGVQTVCRWVCGGHASPDDVTLWAGSLPSDLDLEANGAALRAARVRLVVGTGDEYATREVVAEQEARLHAAHIPFRVTLFDGGHQIEPAVLHRVAAEPAAADLRWPADA